MPSGAGNARLSQETAAGGNQSFCGGLFLKRVTDKFLEQSFAAGSGLTSPWVLDILKTEHC